MKQMLFATALLALAAPLASAQNSTWTSDPMHSEVDFTVRHMGVSNVHGRFGAVKATIVYNETDVTKSTVTATIDVSTVNTGEAARDTHLKTVDFFDVATNPTATFVSTSVWREGGHLKVGGNFTLHGVTKPLVLDVEGPSTPIENPMDHKQHTGFTATTSLSRAAFHIGDKFPAPMVGDEVKLTIEVEAAK